MSNKTLYHGLVRAHFKGRKGFGKRYAAKVTRRYGKALVREGR